MVYFVVLGVMIFKSTSFPPKASSSICSSLCPDQEPESISESVGKCGFKTDRKKGLQVFFRLPPTHTCIYEDI